MMKPELKQSSIKKLGTVKRKAVGMSPHELIKTGFLNTEAQLPLVVKPAVDGLNLTAWATSNREFINANLFKYGGILFRDCNIKTVKEFENFINVTAGELLDYVYRSTVRSQVHNNIFTSTDYPSGAFLPLHSEMAYKRDWPMKIFFFCVKSAKQGGETPIADTRQVFKRIPTKIKDQFMRRKVKYIRNYGYAIDLSWQDAFQTTDKAEVDDYCRKADIECEWKGENHLRTSQVCQAIATHPQTGDTVWFNAAHLHHVSSFPAQVRTQLLSDIKEEDLPRNAYYGDGSPIETSVLDEIRDIYRQEAIFFPWQEGDILMLDNMLAAHGRAAFVGPRKIVVGMAEPRNSYKQQ